MGLASPVRSHYPDEIITNHSSCELSYKKLNYAYYLTPCELLFRDIKELSDDDSVLQRVKVDMKKIRLSSFENFKFKDELKITPDELKALKHLSSRKYIIIQKAETKATPLLF